MEISGGILLLFPPLFVLFKCFFLRMIFVVVIESYKIEDRIEDRGYRIGYRILGG